MSLKHGEYRVHEEHPFGIGSRCGEPLFQAVTANLSEVTCRRCIVMRERNVSVSINEVLRVLAAAATARARRYLVRRVVTC